MDPDSGEKITGGVGGVQARAGINLSPSFANYRWNFALEGQVIQRLSASNGRKTDFDSTMTLVTASIDYALMDTTLDAKKGFLPSIGIQYTDGEDPLVGRADQDTVVLGLRIRY